ncbi:MAG TPA: hypothetical protein VNV37_05605 [Solirubrobacteraceae bacterium]|nr:hypothetical protein [Solirubrobacteraceae bacterium]
MAGALILAAALAGCGGGGGTTTTGTVTVAGTDGASGGRTHVVEGGLAAEQAASGVPAADVAMVQRTPISKVSFEHWMKATAALSHATSDGPAIHAGLQLKALEFLISSRWVLGEAAARGLRVSDAQVRERLHQVTAGSYPTPAALAKYLASVEETEADLLLRVKLELLEAAIVRQVTGGHTAGGHAGAQISAFQRRFKARWRARTSCRPEYVMEDCRQYVPPPSPRAQAAAARRARAAARAHGKPTVAEPTQMEISSPAFPAEGTIPKRYTCAGANTSPPLRWRNVPAGAQELVLLAIDTSYDGPQGATRWILAGLSPHSGGIAAGAMPPGAVLGENSGGGIQYGGICPWQGKPATVELTLWALSHKAALNKGFTISEGLRAFRGITISSATMYGTAPEGR